MVKVKLITGLISSVAFLLCTTAGAANIKQKATYTVESPDKSLVLSVDVKDRITYSVSLEGKLILGLSAISMTLGDDINLGEDPVVTDAGLKHINQRISSVVPEKFAVIDDKCDELTLEFEGDYSVIFRVYDNGVAYRFKTSFKKDLKVLYEKAEFNFVGKNSVYFPEEKSFFSHNEPSYLLESLDTMAAGRLASLPLLVSSSGVKLLIAESALIDYPGMWVKTGGNNNLYGVFSHYPLESKLNENSDRDCPVTKSAEYIAMTKGDRAFPWRIVAIAKKDGDLITNQLVYQLALELRIKDTSWIKPGKVAWDWWNANNIYGVDFKSGINTQTYKYYIDFASRFGIEYIILDEGWYRLGNLFDVAPAMDIKELIDYGRKNNVGVILWVIWKTLDDQLILALDQFEKWGAAGIKVDFMQRDDQKMVNFYWKVAEEAAKRKMLVDYHGAYKPSGLRRAYPNVITREGLKGLEHNKWSRDITSAHNLTLPFIRMVAGPMDYTPGAMTNAQPGNFNSVFTRPMSMGTRMHQIAMYVIFESPLQMIADSPSGYLKEKECTEFISKIPTTWDHTLVLEASVGEYIVLARKKADKWYIGAMTNENPREFTVDLSFLDGSDYYAEIMEDGVNADRYASDYRKTELIVSKKDTLTVKMAPNGGWAAILKLK